MDEITNNNSEHILTPEEEQERQLKIEELNRRLIREDKK